MTVPIGSEECAEEKKALSVWKKIGIITSTLLGVLAVVTIVYKLDCYNIIVHGDTVFAKDTELAKEVKQDRAHLEKLRKQLELEQQIRRAHTKLERFNAEYQANLLFLNEVRKQYPNKDDIPDETFTQYKKVKEKNKKVLANIEQWEKRLNELEMKELTTSNTTKGGEQ
jgi:Zn-dependent M32 family carboxypeptidase